MNTVGCGQFLWGTPSDLKPVLNDEVAQFRLTSSCAQLPRVILTSAVPGGRTLRRAGRVVAHVWEDDEAHYLLALGVLPRDLTASRKDQTTSVFEELESLLADEKMSFRQVVRTWFYVDHICDWYPTFNGARSAFFEPRHVFETFLPASTGIGCANLDGAALSAGAFAVLPKDPRTYAEIVPSPLQTSAMTYKSSFSRAAELITPSMRQLFISGTASIEPNSSAVAYVGDPARQVWCTMHAVEAILESRGYVGEDVNHALVYLKRPEYLSFWRDWLKAHPAWSRDVICETVCDVCRDEWLFEIEVSACKGRAKI